MTLKTVPIGSVRYIKLGEAGAWAQECIDESKVRISFDSEEPDVFRACIARNWNGVREHWAAKGVAPGTATSYSNQLQIFYEDAGDILWFTIHNYRLWWTRLDSTALRAMTPKALFGNAGRGPARTSTAIR